MQRTFTYLGIGLTALSTLMLEILLTRITSVVVWYHLAFFVISLAMLGMTAGAVWVFLDARRFTEALALERMHQTVLGFAWTLPIAVTIALRIPLRPVEDLGSFLALLGYGLCLAIPFTFAGASLTVALTRAGLPTGIAYGIDLCGAALGCVLVIPLLDWIDAPSAVLLCGAVAALAGLAFARSAGRTPDHAGILAVVLAAAAVVNSTVEPPLLRPRWVKGVQEDARTFETVDWNTYSRVTVGKPEFLKPTFWSAGGNTPDSLLETPVVRKMVLIDGAAGTVMLERGDDPLRHAHLDWDVSSFVHRVRPDGSVAVIGVGGGRDIVAALRTGHSPVVGIELNDAILDLHHDGAGGYSRIGMLPEVELVVDEARSFLTRDDRRYAVIVMSLIDTWAATGAGAYSLTENGLYTVEAWNTILDRLEPDGVFSVTRWYKPGSPGETARMIALAERLGMDVVLSPRKSPSVVPLTELAALPDRDSLETWTAAQRLDFRPPTDDRPFFFNMLRPSDWLTRGDEVAELDYFFLGNLQATQTLLHAILVSIVLTLLAIGIPLFLARPRVRREATGRVAAAAAYFALIGCGFMLVEIGLLSRLNVFLGHPVLALAVVLGGVIFFAGAGSLATARLSLAKRWIAVAYPLVPAALILLVAAISPAVLSAYSGAHTPTRILVGLLIVAPPSLGLGLGFPLGLRLVTHHTSGRNGGTDEQDLAPWLWGLNGAFGVCAGGIALAISMVWGVSMTLTIGAACYLVLPAMTWRLSARS